MQGFLLAIVFVTNKKFNRKSNQYLALLIFCLSLMNLVNALRESRLDESLKILDYLPLYWFFLIPFTLYYFIQYLLNPDYHFARKEYLALMPFLIHFSFWSLRFLLFAFDASLLNTYRSFFWGCNNVFEVTAMLATLIVLILNIRKLNAYQSHLVDNYSDIESQSLNWVKYTMIASLVLLGFWAVPFFSGAPDRSYYYPLFIGQALIIYWLGYMMYSKSDLFEMSEILSESIPEDPGNGDLSQKTEEHYQNLLRLIEEEKLFKNPDLNMTLLAGKMKLSNGYLSQIINQREGKNFFEFINTYRVEEVKHNLKDPAYDHFSILGIALEAGFKSKSTFNAVFKKMTGHTPSAYKNLIQGERSI
ncbi:MAG: AraC family transcriptional regulator [Bacteroidetes bacterium]|nr:AraC family transcriptional regulator [Bacteroidota bacterium]